MPDRRTSRRSFFQAGAGAALLCTIGGEQVDLKPRARPSAPTPPPRACPGRPPRGSRRSSPPRAGPGRRTASTGSRPARSAGTSCRPAATTGTAARSAARRPSARYLYQEMTEGFAAPKGGLNMPGPTLYAEVGDVIVVHFRNADTKLDQAVTMHPHGVRYTPEYDGAYLGKYTRAGGFVAPGEEFTSSGSASPGGGRRVAVPRPRPQPHGQHVTRPVRRDRDLRARREGPRRELHADAPPAHAADHRPAPRVPVHQRPRVRGQHPDAEGQGRPGRRDPRVRDGLQLPRLPHARAPLEGHRRRAPPTPPRWGRARP